MIGVSGDGSAVKMFDENGVMRAIMGLYMDGSSGLVLIDSGGSIRLGMGVDGGGSPQINMFDERGEIQFEAPGGDRR